jgi:pimeloyl-ACP methyl ester carboxylesterase
MIMGERTDAHASLINGAKKRRAEFASRDAAFAAYRGRGAFATWPDEILADYVEAGFGDLPDGRVRLTCEPEWEASTFLAQANDPWEDFARAPCPIEILKAERASTCRTDGAEADLTASGLVSIQTIAGTSHFLPMERPALVRDTLANALEAR